MAEEPQSSSDTVKTFKDLIREVHEPGLCGLCGGCVSFCSAGELMAIGFNEEGKPKLVDEANCLECGICYLICPQIDILDQEIMDFFGYEAPMGSFKKVVCARSTNPDIRDVSTDGGVVSGILHCLLDRKMINGAVVTKKTSHFTRIPMIAITYEDILAAAGSKFSSIDGLGELGRFSTYSPTMFAIKETQNMDLVKIAVVGTPCQIHTLRKMQNLSVVPSHVVKFALGLFCTESFSFDASKREDVEKILNMKFADISKLNLKEDLILRSKEGKIKHIPLENMRDFIRSACLACTDFSNDYADISFGGLGSPEGWTTVMIRTDTGEMIFEEAVNRGFIEVLSRHHEEFEAELLQGIISKITRFSEMKRDRGIVTKKKARQD